MSAQTTIPQISYSIDLELSVIFEMWAGDVTAADLRRHWLKYLANPGVLRLRRMLVDLRAASTKFTGREFSDVVWAVAVPAP